MKLAKAVIAAAPLAALALAAPASASAAGHTHRSHQKQFAACHAQGGYAICDASGITYHPLSVVLHVTSSPGQHVSGAWDVTCSKGLGTGSKSGSFSGTTPYKKTLRLNYRRPDSCIVSADAQLGTGGTVTVRLVAWKRDR
jgi:hypothetical protein